MGLDANAPTSINNMTESQVTQAHQSFIKFVCTQTTGVLAVPANMTVPQGNAVQLPRTVDFRDQCGQHVQ